MKIVFLNVLNCKIIDGIREFIDKHSGDTDVFCFQEAYDESKSLFAELLSNYQLISDYKFVNEKDDFPQATYIKNTLKVNASETLLADIPNTGLGIYTQFTSGNRAINLCNLHGISKPGDKLDTSERLQQSEIIIDYFRDFAGPTIIGGDLNLDFDSQSIKMFEDNGYRNLIKEFKIPTTRNKLVWDLFPNKQYFSDYVFVNPATEVKQFVVEDVEISDHLPMILEINNI